jgi:AcrR family transcriptional regulator
MSLDDITVHAHDTKCHHYAGRMGRWAPNARGRLEQAAMELYRERGFEQTTVAEIAERAGLTKRTFFRHFTDKRDVLFAGAHLLQERVAGAVAGAPESAAPITAVAAGIQSAVTLLQENPERVRDRQAVVSANPELRERELIKLASLAAAVADALRARGVAPRAADLAAEAGIAAFKVAVESWIATPDDRDLPRLVRDVFAELRAVTAEA